MARRVLLPALLAAASAATSASITGLRWVEVDNSVSPYPPHAAPGTDPVAGAAWSAQPGGWRTFDLYVDGAVGARYSGLEVGGGDPATQRIRVVNGTVFNHPLGGNNRSQATESFFSALPFDTFTTAGGGPTSPGQSTSFSGPVNLTGAGGVLQFYAFTQPPAPLTPDPNSASGGSIWVLRVTVSASTLQLGGGDSRCRVLGPGVSIAFDVPDAFSPPPLPDPFALVAPAVGARCLAIPVRLEWQPSFRAQTYDVEVSLDEGFSTIHYAARGLTTTSHTPPITAVDRGRTYFWRVAAVNIGGTTFSSQPDGRFSTVLAGDVDQNGMVNFTDLNAVLGSIGSRPGDPLYNPLVDLNHSGQIDFPDLNIVLANLRMTCGQ